MTSSAAYALKTAFTEQLAALYDTVRPAFLASETAYFRRQADAQVKQYVELLAAGPPERKVQAWDSYKRYEAGPLVRFALAPLRDDEWGSRDYYLPAKIGDRTDPAVRARFRLDDPLRAELQQAKPWAQWDDPVRWAGRAKLAAAGLYVPDYDRADQLAAESVRTAGEHFAAKGAAKLAEAVGGRAVAAMSGGLRLDGGVVTGHLDVTAAGGDSFRAELDVVTNFRYGQNARDGKLTVYHQFPLRFRSVRVGGETKKTAAVGWMAAHFATAAAPGAVA